MRCITKENITKLKERGLNMRKDNMNLRKEHEAVRKHVGFYDFTHELLEVNGKNARSFLDKMFVNSVARTKPGTAVYTTMLNEDGIIIDDVIIFCLEEEKFWVSTLFIDAMLEWFKGYSDMEDLEFKDLSKEVAMWAVQGPDSQKLLNEILEKDISHLEFFQMEDNKIEDIEVKISRSGFTGELGYEVFFSPEYGDKIDKILLEKGKPYNVVQLTSEVVLMSLPGEKGYVIMDDLKGTNPLEVGFGWSVDWSKDFVGKEALEKVKKEGAKRRLRGFTVEDDNLEIKHDSTVRVDGKEVGRVTKSFYGYTVEKNIGYILLDKSHAKIGDKVTIINDNKEVEATLTERVFYDPKDLRVKP